MAYTTDTDTKTTITWDDNPYGGETVAVIIDGVVDSLVVQDANFVSAIYSKDIVYLEHLRDTITDLITELTP